MAFSRQHFVKFADLLKKMHGKDQETLAIELIKMFKEDNPRFDTDRFLKAAGVEASTRISRGIMPETTSPTGGKTAFKVNESFDNVGIKLVTLLPSGQITTLRHGDSAKKVNELAFHGGNPTPADVQVLADDFEEEFDKVQEQFDETHHGFVDAARETEFNDVATAIEKQWNTFARAVAAYRANIEKIYKDKMKKLGGK